MIACLALAALAACASDRAEPAKTVYEAVFAPELPDLVVVEVTDDEPVTAARLVAPDGALWILEYSGDAARVRRIGKDGKDAVDAPWSAGVRSRK